MIKTLNEDTRSSKDDLIFFNQALEYFDYPVDQLSNENRNSQKNLILKDSDLLKHEMLAELNRLKEVIINNPDAKLQALSESERQVFFDFIRKFSICPICGNQNHYLYLKKLYFNEDKRVMKDALLNLMIHKYYKIKINFGVPCCNCFKKYFEE